MIIDRLIVLASGCLIMAVVLTIFYYFVRRWEDNNLFCDRCQTRGAGIKTIRLADQLTGFKICQECSQNNTIGSKDAIWALILQRLYQMAQDIEGCNITTATFWPKGIKTKKPLTIDEIVPEALIEALWKGTDLP